MIGSASNFSRYVCLSCGAPTHARYVHSAMCMVGGQSVLYVRDFLKIQAHTHHQDHNA